MALCSPYPSANPPGCTPLLEEPLVPVNPYLPTPRLPAETSLPTEFALPPVTVPDFVPRLEDELTLSFPPMSFHGPTPDSVAVEAPSVLACVLVAGLALAFTRYCR